MLVYHGSTFIVKNPEIRPVQRPLDFGDCKCKWFRTTSDEWIDLVILHRKATTYKNGLPLIAVHHLHDAVYGEMVDDQIYDSIHDYEMGYITRRELKMRLKFKHKNDQLSFNTDKALKYLCFVKYYSL